MRKRIFSFILAVFMVVGLLPSVALHAMAVGGNWADLASSAVAGTDYTVSGDNYLVKTEIGLAWVSAQTNNNSGWSAGKSISLEKDLNLSGRNWTPMGRFNGLFDGNGHVIKNLTINETAGVSYYYGLFGYVKTGTWSCIKNLGLVDVNITVTMSPSFNGNYVRVGALAAESDGVVVINCYSTGTVSINSPTLVKLGGLVGDANTTILNSYSTCSLSGICDNVGSVVGGIAGDNGDTVINLKNCYFAGNIVGGRASNAAVGALLGEGCSEPRFGKDSLKNVYWLRSGDQTVAGTQRNAADKKWLGALTVNEEVNIISFAENDTLESTCVINRENGTNLYTGTSLVDALNASVNADADTGLYTWKVDGGYPVLDAPWENTYKATVNVKVDGVATAIGDAVKDAIELAVSTNGTNYTAMTAGTAGTYTAANLTGSTTYNVYYKVGTKYTKIGSVSDATPLNVDYYTVTLTKGTGIASVSGGGTYLKSSSANINATLLAGYEWDKWSDSNPNQNRSVPVTQTTNLTAYGKLKDAAVTLTGSDPAAVTFGYSSAPSMTVGISNKDDTNFNYTYAWYEGSNATGTVIATTDTYTAPTGLGADNHPYTVKVTATNKADASKPASAEKTFTVTVNKASGSGSVSMAGWTYGGTASNPVPSSDTNGTDTSSIIYEYESKDGTSYPKCTAKPTKAGDYSVTATFKAAANYNQCTATENFTISKATLTPSVSGVTGKTYDGDTTASGEISLSGTVNGEKPTATGTFAWTSKNASTTTVDVTGITLSGSWGSNYTLSTTSLTGVTAPSGSKINPQALAISAQTAVYNGTTSIKVKEYETKVGSEKIDLTYTPSVKSTGTYVLGAATNGFTLVLSDPNYSVATAGDLTISPKALTIPAQSVIYNGGKSFTNTVIGENSENVTVTYTLHDKNVGNYSYNAAGGAGKYTMALSDAVNYSIASGDTLTVNPLPAMLTWDYNTVPFTYDKTEKSITATVTNKIDGDTFNLTYRGNSGTVKGDYTATVTDLGNNNYTLTGARGVEQKWAIAAQPVAKPTADATVFTYTGSEQTYTIASNALYTVKNDKRTNAGSQDVTVSLNDKSNYTWADWQTEDLTYTFSIAKAPITFEVSGNSYTYDKTSKTATVTQTADQAPLVAGKFTVTYQQSGSTVTPQDAGDYDVMVTLSDDNFKFAGQEDSVRTGKVGAMTINKKSITALWQNLHHVYDGTDKAPTFGLTDVVDGDKTEVTAQLSAASSKTAAGSYPVVAELTGTRSSNYTLTNPTGTLVIQKAPVTFAVSGDMVQYDGSAKTATVTATASGDTFADTGFSVTYQKDGKAVETPTDIGSYDIYAECKNINYRHVDGTDGTARKIGVLNIYKDTAPATYTLSFLPGEGGSGSMTALTAAQAGTARALPECAFTKSGSIFAGWKYNGNTYQPGEVLEQPATNITLIALWSKSTFTINGVVDQNGNPAADAVATLMLGSRQIAETVTASDGSYSFANVAPGLYNLVVSKNGVIQTVKVEIIAADVADENITLPLGKTNSVVQIASGSPSIVVGNLEQTFSKTGTVYTTQDQADVAAGGSVEIKLTAKLLTDNKTDDDQSEIAKKASGTVALFLDLKLEKTVTKKGGKPEPTEVPVSDVLLESIIQLPGELQGKSDYTVCRRHDGKIDTLTTSRNKDGEYIKVNSEKTTLTVYCKNFSTYAIAYTTYSGGGGENNAELAPSDHGKVTVAPEKPSPNNKVTITATPDKGYKVDTVTVTDSKGNKLKIDYNGNNTYSYVQPNGKVTIAVTFKLADGKLTWNPFADVTKDSWFYDAVKYVYENNLMNGAEERAFEPDTATTRGMIVTVLYRMEGSPIGFENTVFSDVPADSYYSKAIGWGFKNGIVKGYDESQYGPEDNITREQMAAIIYRYADFKKYDLNKTTALEIFADGNGTSDFAKKAMSWAVGNELLSGKGDGVLDPTGEATRAEVATILMRFDAKFGKKA